MKIIPLFLFVFFCGCSVSTDLATKHCRQKLGPNIQAKSPDFKKCFDDKKTALLKNYGEYKKREKSCWEDTDITVPVEYEEVTTYIPSQEIYDLNDNVIAQTEEIDRVEYKQTKLNRISRRHYFNQCMKDNSHDLDIQEIKPLVNEIDNMFYFE